MALTKPKTTKNEVSVSIDLEPLLGKLAEDRSIRETFFQLALERLLDRTASGRDIENKLFPKYSKTYTESLAYQVFKTSNVPNLELTGDMLGSIEIKSQDAKKMVVAVSEAEALKAYAHMTGFKGHPTIKSGPQRKFFGWSDKELKDIAKEFKPLVKQAEKATVSDRQIETLIDRLLEDDDGEG